MEATAPAGPIEVALSAGQSSAWTLDLLELTVGESDKADPEDKDKGGKDQVRALREPTGPTPTIIAQEIGPKAQARAEANARARALFAEEKDAEAEKVLTDSNRNPKGTPEWYLESANALVQTALSFTRAGRPEKAVQIAQRALEHTDKAARKAARLTGQEGLIAAADETAAFIHERLLADYDAAKAFYRQAALHYPQGKEGRDLRRLERIEKSADRQTRATAR